MRKRKEVEGLGIHQAKHGSMCLFQVFLLKVPKLLVLAHILLTIPYNLSLSLYSFTIKFDFGKVC
jgi:hypothetical protein